MTMYKELVTLILVLAQLSTNEVHAALVPATHELNVGNLAEFNADAALATEVTFMEVDLADAEKLLVTQTNSIYSVAKTGAATKETGESGTGVIADTNPLKYNDIKGFVQTSATEILIVDNGNFCVRKFARGATAAAATATEFAGTCGTADAATSPLATDGVAGTGRIRAVSSILRGVGASVDTLYLSETASFMIRTVDISSAATAGTVDKLSAVATAAATALEWLDGAAAATFIRVEGGAMKTSLLTAPGSSSAFTTNPGAPTANVGDVVHLDGKVYIASNSMTNKVIIFSQDGSAADSSDAMTICTGGTTVTAGAAGTCQIVGPSALQYAGGNLYIAAGATGTKIYKVPVSVDLITTTTTTTTTPSTTTAASGSTNFNGFCASGTPSSFVTKSCTGGCFGLLNDGKPSVGCLNDLSVSGHGFTGVTTCNADHKEGSCKDYGTGDSKVENCLRCCESGNGCNAFFEKKCDYLASEDCEKECSGAAAVTFTGLTLLLAAICSMFQLN